MFDYRAIYACEYDVPDGGDCGEPATHFVWWDNFGKPMKVCTEHFNYIKECEKDEEIVDKSNQRETEDRTKTEG